MGLTAPTNTDALNFRWIFLHLKQSVPQSNHLTGVLLLLFHWHSSVEEPVLHPRPAPAPLQLWGAGGKAGPPSRGAGSTPVNGAEQRGLSHSPGRHTTRTQLPQAPTCSHTARPSVHFLNLKISARFQIQQMISACQKQIIPDWDKLYFIICDFIFAYIVGIGQLGY